MLIDDDDVKKNYARKIVESTAVC